MLALLIDNYDSFTYNLFDYIRQLDIDCKVIRNDEVSMDDLESLSFDNIVLSPGPEKPNDAGRMMEIIRRYHSQMPILGICLGHQAIGEFFGAKLRKAEVPMHGKPVVVRHYGHDLYDGIEEQFDVMCYHSLVLDETEGSPLKILARSSNGDIMSFVHEKKQLFGVQFHPESVLTSSGLKLLENWFRLIKTE